MLCLCRLLLPPPACRGQGTPVRGGMDMLIAWRAQDVQGHTHQGRLQAPSRALARAQLRRQGLEPCSLERIWWHRPVRHDPRLLGPLTRQLATLLQAGVPLLQALSLLQQGAGTGGWTHTLQALSQEVSAGHSLHAAMARQPQAFSALYRQMVAAGEIAGDLTGSLQRLADMLERNEALRARLRAALMYPALVLLVCLAVVGLILIWVVPVFEDVFRSFGAALPWPTQAVVLASRGLASAAPALWAGAALAAVLLRTTPVRQRLWPAWQNGLLRLPLLGDLVRQSVLARWSQTLASLLTSGIPLAEALLPAGLASGHPAYVRASRRLQRRIAQGSSLHEAMAGHPRFPVQLVQMCMIGEETGTLAVMLGRAGQALASDFETRLQGLNTLLEPLIIVFLGLTIGSILVAMYLPIFQLGQVF